MERLILDTGALIAFERGRGELPDGDDVAIAAITASELLIGVELADTPHRPRRAALVEAALEVFEVLAFDLVAARHHARLAAYARRSGTARGAHDLIIAATAAATGRLVVTTDGRAFAGLPGVAHRLLESA